MIYNDIYFSLLNQVLTDPICSKLEDKHILVTGATGMIGSFLIDVLMQKNKSSNNIHVYALARSKEKMMKRFSDYYENDHFHFIQQDILQPLMIDESIDYIVHAASNANPKAYATQPVETITGNFIGMQNLLEWSKGKKCRLLYVSSGEMYGVADSNTEGFDETYSGFVDYSSSRACYPAGKRASEVLCQSYIDEYNADAVIVRPCHVYGPTMQDSDTRVISEFLRNGVKKEGITLKSKGEQIRSHCFVSDAILGLLYVLLKGTTGEAYNVAADDSIYSIKEMAEMVCNISGQPLRFDLPDDIEQKGFSKVPVAVLKNDKLKTLGWKSQYGLEDGIRKTIEVLKEDEHNG